MLGFGTTLWLRAGHTNTAQLDAALDAAVKALQAIESEMSLFNPDSAVSRLNAKGVLHQPSAHLRAVLAWSAHVSRSSAGAFDISMQPLWKVWVEAQAQHQLPSKRAVMHAQQQVNWQAVEVSADAVRLNLKGMGVSLNGIAQGYAADVVKAVLQAHGIAHAQIDAGETTLLGQAPGGQPWTLAVESVNKSSPVLRMDGRAIATSSDAHTAFSADHVNHHILNPHTGYSPAHWASVTVLAPCCVMADALTKVFFMSSPQQLHATAQAWGVDVLAQRKHGAWVKTAGVPLQTSINKT
jgi:thiamine biosynthesis lipoprotein